MHEAVRSAARWYLYRVGRRGTFLLGLALAWTLVGVGVLMNSIPATRIVPFPHETLPVWLRALGWFGTATVAVLCAFTRNIKIDAVAFGLICLMPAQRATSYMLSWFYSFDGGYGGQQFATAWTSASVWGAVIIMVLVVASWPEPPMLRRLVSSDGS